MAQAVAIDTSVSRVVSDVEQSRVFLASRVVHLFPYIARLRVVISRAVPTAGVTKSGDIVVNPDFWELVMKEPVLSKESIILHEVLHSALAHVERGEGRDPLLWNLATDAFVNKIVKFICGDGSYAVERGVTLERLYEDLVKRAYPNITLEQMYEMSEEELYNLLRKSARALDGGIAIVERIFRGRWECEGGAGEGCPRAQGTEEIGVDDEEVEEKKVGEVKPMIEPGVEGGYKEPEDVTREVNRVKTDIATEVYEKRAGTEPGLAERVVRSLKPRKRVDWRTLLSEILKREGGRTVVQTWKRSSRRFEDMPGVRRLGPRGLKVLFLVDVSGSIPDELLSRFISESLVAVHDAGLDPSTTYVVTWDTEVKSVATISEVVSKGFRTTGGGGTIVDGALEYVANSRPDIVVVLTDGIILTTEKTAELANKVRSTTRKAIILYTDVLPREFEGWVAVKYQPGEE